jgi:2-dehydro-3-deoxy-L-rhamnonate dehydrogenase (NAD+)
MRDRRTRRAIPDGALVVGAGSGIGASVIDELAGRGYDVVAADVSTDGAQADRALRFIDVGREESVASEIARADRETGGLSIVVNCAGILGPVEPSIDVDMSTIERILRVNFLGSVAVTKHALATMIPRGYGRIVHVASIAGREGNPQMMAYSASKAAVIAMVKTVGREYAATGVTVNAIAPGLIDTPFLGTLTDERREAQLSLIPMRRIGTPDEIAALVGYVSSPEASFTTGVVFDASGGRFTG